MAIYKVCHLTLDFKIYLTFREKCVRNKSYDWKGWLTTIFILPKYTIYSLHFLF